MSIIEENEDGATEHRRDQPGRYPTPAEVRAMREKLQEKRGLNVTEAIDLCAALMYTHRRVFQKWERGEARMHPAFWELFQLKVLAAGRRRRGSA